MGTRRVDKGRTAFRAVNRAHRRIFRFLANLSWAVPHPGTEFQSVSEIQVLVLYTPVDDRTYIVSMQCSDTPTWTRLPTYVAQNEI